MQMKREIGFYWAREINDDWQPAYWGEDGFRLLFRDDWFPHDYPYVIWGDKIEKK